MHPPHPDKPLSVERLATADLNAVGHAVAAILTANHVGQTTQQTPFVISVHWLEAPTGERWDISLTDVTVALDRSALAAEAERLLRSILHAMRPRALTYAFRSRMDEATFEDLNVIGNAGVMPGAEAFEPRWVEDRTVLRIAGGPGNGASATEARAFLEEINRRLA